MENQELVLKMQQGEVNEVLIYQGIAKNVKDPKEKATLLQIAKEESKHAAIWEKITGVKLKPQMFKVRYYIILSYIFGYTFAIKKMENGEVTAADNYQILVNSYPQAHQIYLDESRHEEQLIEILQEERLNYIGSMVLGLNDALVELSGTLAGLCLALQNNRLIALTGLVTGIAATLSMASSEYLSSRSEGSNDAIKSAAYTGVMYIIVVILLALPYLLLPPDWYIAALFVMLSVVVSIIAVFTYYVSVIKNLSFRKQFLEMVTISLSVAFISFIIGIIIKQVLGVDV